MQKGIFLLLLLSICLNFSGQEGYMNWEKTKLHGKVRSITAKYSYPPSNYKLKEGEVLIPRKVEVFTDIFNTKGNRVKRIMTKPGAGLSWENIFKYDNSGNMIEDFETDAGGDFYLKIFFTYDSKKNLLEKKECHNYGEDCQLCKFIYDSQKNLIEKSDYWRDSTLSWKSSYKYDGNGNCIKEVRYDSDDKPRYTYYFSYDSKRNMIGKRELFEDTIEWRRTTYLYDNRNNLTETKSYDQPNGDLIEKITSKYDKYGNKTEETRYLSDGNANNQLNYQYEYDKTRNWIKRIELQNGKQISLVERAIIYF